MLWYLQRRLSRRTADRRVARPITVLARQALGSKAQLVVVQTDDARYVLGVTEHGVSVVDRLPTDPGAAGAPAALAARPSADAPARLSAAFAGALAAAAAQDAATPGELATAQDAAAAPLRRAALRSDHRAARTTTTDPFAAVSTLGGLWPRGLGSGRRSAGSAASRPRFLRWTLLIAGVVVGGGVLAMALGTPAHAAVVEQAPATSIAAAAPAIAVPASAPTMTAPTVDDPVAPTPPVVETPAPGVTIDVNGIDGSPSASILTLLGITLLSVAPALLLMMSSFTKIFVVLAMTRNALSLPTIPPNQVLAGLALFLSLFIMWPVLTDINQVAAQPYIHGDITFAQAVDLGQAPLRDWMLRFTREDDLALLTRVADAPNPADPQSVPMYTLIPAFMLSELRAAFVIGLVIFVPFLVIDLVVAAALMSMGMMMLPPVMISLPFKILLFILVDGWGLIVRSLVESYGGTG